MKEQANAAMPALSRRAFVGTAAAAAGVVAATSQPDVRRAARKRKTRRTIPPLIRSQIATRVTPAARPSASITC